MFTVVVQGKVGLSKEQEAIHLNLALTAARQWVCYYVSYNVQLSPPWELFFLLLISVRRSARVWRST